jgi:hypothetical protein
MADVCSTEVEIRSNLHDFGRGYISRLENRIFFLLVGGAKYLWFKDNFLHRRLVVKSSTLPNFHGRNASKIKFLHNFPLEIENNKTENHTRIFWYLDI